MDEQSILLQLLGVPPSTPSPTPEQMDAHEQFARGYQATGWRRPARKTLESVQDLLLGALGFPQNDSRSSLAGEMLSAAVPVVGGLKALRIKNPIKAYHGSPHDFDAFKMSQIGTGEGAQAYGHGLYFAENPAVAQDYKRRLSGDAGYIPGAASGVGKYMANNVPAPGGISGHKALDTASDIQQLLYYRQSGAQDMDRYLSQTIENRIARWRGEVDPRNPGGSANEDMKALADYYEQHVKGATPKDVSQRPPGRMYEVNLHVDPNELLDWDAPLSQQSQKVRNLVTALDRPVRLENLSRRELIERLQSVDSNGVWTDAANIAEFGRPATHAELVEAGRSMGLEDYLNQPITQVAPNASGQSLYQQLSTREGGGGMSNAQGQLSASDKLKSLGIPGIKYFDAQSRSVDPDVVRKNLAAARAEFAKWGTPEASRHPNAANQREMFQKQIDSLETTLAHAEANPRTRNYVMFDENRIELVKKFGIALALGAGLISQAEADQLKAQGYQ